jgi:hypothetical protein
VDGIELGLRQKFFTEFVNFLIYLFFMMFGALFRPGYDKMGAFASLTFVISGAVVGYFYGHVGIEVFYVAATQLTLSAIVSAMVYSIRKLLFISFNLQAEAQDSTKSVNDLLDNLPDSVLLLSERPLQSTDQMVQQGIAKQIDVLGKESEIIIGEDFGGVNY